MTTSQNLDGRLALVTGASRGIGWAVAKGLAAAGADLILLARTSGALEELDDEVRKISGKPATLVPLDVKDYDGIDRLGASVFEKWGKLDILIGNAAIAGILGPLGHITPKDWQNLLDINVTANWRLIRAFDPLLKLSDAGRAVFVSSGAAHKTPPFWGGYGMSKAALEHIALTYAAECETTPVRVNVINPGPVRTGMRAKAMPGEDPNTLPHPDELAPLFVEMASPNYLQNGQVVNFYDVK
jgi:NAD(P)-dependent dehydrogenase (short-subunit alcohol dehydrogenase family)